jgi:hypothetical protein
VTVERLGFTTLSHTLADLLRLGRSTAPLPAAYVFQLLARFALDAARQHLKPYHHVQLPGIFR